MTPIAAYFCDSKCSGLCGAGSWGALTGLSAVGSPPELKHSGLCPNQPFSQGHRASRPKFSSLQRKLHSPWRLKFMNKFMPRVMQTLKDQGRLYNKQIISLL